MNDFKQIAEINGVPVYYNKTPDGIHNSAIRLAVLTGSIDDTFIGKPGLYHWFEHVPFRGTKKYPGRNKNLRTLIDNTGGNIGASTGYYTTEFNAHVPTSHLTLAVDVVTDLVASPLLRAKDVESERKIIREEISEGLGKPRRLMFQSIMQEVWKDHPLQYPVIGNLESLNGMTHEDLLLARRKGYSTSRMIFLMSTSLSEMEVIRMLKPRFRDLPYHADVSVRKTAVVVKQMKWEAGTEKILPTKQASSAVELLFPTKAGMETPERMVKEWMMRSIFTHGMTDSPLLRDIRHRKSLAYSGFTTSFESPDGGHFGFHVDTQHPEKVLEILKHGVLNDKRLLSRPWFKKVKQALRDEKDMQTPSPWGDVNSMCNCLVYTGSVLTDAQMYGLLDELQFETIQDELDKMRSLETARTFIFEGGK